MQILELNGAPVGPDDLRTLALINYGHFTSMQVREGRVRGLDLHLARLQTATRELFGSDLDLDRVRAWLRGPGTSMPALSLRVTVFARTLDRDRLDRAVAADVLVAAGPARGCPPQPLRLCSVRYRRELAHIKHVGTFGLLHARRQAQLAGFDDALLLGGDGAVAEGSVWNIGFFDGTRVAWPDAPALAGISMQLIQRGLRAIGVESVTARVPLAGVGAFRSAFLTNSTCPMVPVAAIDDVPFAPDAAMAAIVERAHATQPWQAL